VLRPVTVLAVLAATTTAGCTWGSPAPPRTGVATASGSDPAAVSGVVVEVVDGDTIEVGGVGRVRIIGIDTPERGECGFESATQRLAELVLDERVALVGGSVDALDRYGRLLRYVDVGGVDAGLVLLEEGWAVARYDSRDGYGAHPREAGYVQAQTQAPGKAQVVVGDAADDMAADYECRSP